MVRRKNILIVCKYRQTWVILPLWWCAWRFDPVAKKSTELSFLDTELYHRTILHTPPLLYLPVLAIHPPPPPYHLRTLSSCLLLLRGISFSPNRQHFLLWLLLCWLNVELPMSETKRQFWKQRRQTTFFRNFFFGQDVTVRQINPWMCAEEVEDGSGISITPQKFSLLPNKHCTTKLFLTKKFHNQVRRWCLLFL